MKALKGRIIKQRFMGFDVETYGNENTFYSGGFWWIDEKNKVNWKYFKDAQKMRDFILRWKYREYTVVATNLSFDFTVLFWNTKYWNDFKIIMRGSKIMLAEYKFSSRNGKIKFIDTMNYIPFSVSDLGDIVNEPKLKQPSFWVKDKDGKIIDTPKPSDYYEDRELEIYNKQDCKISALFMDFLQEGINKLGGNLKITAASTSLDVWRRNFQPFNLTKEEFIIGDYDIKDFIYKAYYGGRTEAFKRGYIEDYNYYDINSLYPSVMQLPLPNPNTVFKPESTNVKNIIHYEGVTECTVYCPYMKYPLLPYRHDNKLKFPIGSFSGVWNNCELRKAIEVGYEITDIKKQVLYKDTFYPFREFIKTLYSLRQEYKKEGSNMQLLVKLIMNSCYGKFAQRHLQDYKVVDSAYLSNDDLLKISNGSVEFDMIDDKIIMKKNKVCNSIFTFPILSSYITSYARLLMYKYINKYEPVYTDTDSIITNKHIEDSNELGFMKLEEKVKSGIIIKPKLYMINETIKAKGIKYPDKKAFKDILQGNKIYRDKFTTLKESIRKHIIPNTIIETHKKVDLEDTKRKWDKLFNHKELQDSEPVLINEFKENKILNEY